MTTARTPFEAVLPVAQREATPAMDLARRAATGDDEATSELLRALAPRMASTVRRVLGPMHPDADDAVQQAMIGLVRALPAFRGDAEPAGYATIIAVRAALAVRRRSRSDAALRSFETEVESMPSRRASPNDDAVADRRRALVRSLLSELPIEQAEALAMRIMLGWSLREIAHHMGTPLNTVRSRIRLAKEALKRRIEATPGMADALDV